MLSAASLLLLNSASVGMAADVPIFHEGEGVMDTQPAAVEEHIYFGRRLEERLLELGTGPEKFEVLELNLIKAQIKAFIPPLLLPAGNPAHAFVMPPGLWAVATSFKFTTVMPTDFMSNGTVNLEDKDRSVMRQFYNLQFKYGFDLNQKFLHGFTAIINVPYQISSIRGSVFLDNQGGNKFGSESKVDTERTTSTGPGNNFAFQTIVNNGGLAEGLGDVSIFVKKKIWDQGSFPLGLAIAAGVFLPTGSNDEKAGDDGRITIRCQGDVNPQNIGFGSTKPDGSARGELGTGCPPSFANFNIGTGNGPDANFDAAGNKLFVQPGELLRPPGFRRPVFKRFTDDGRFPTGVQPGKGTFSYQIAGFMTKQFVPGDLPGWLTGTGFDRSALHFAVFHRFNSRFDGVDPGDTTGFVANYVMPVYKDYVSIQFTSVNFLQERDQYDGVFAFPGSADFVSNVKTGQPPPVGSFAPDRLTFRHGWTQLVGPSIIFAPDPLMRFTGSALVRVGAPNKGPSPHLVINIGASVVF